MHFLLCLVQFFVFCLIFLAKYGMEGKQNKSKTCSAPVYERSFIKIKKKWEMKKRSIRLLLLNVEER